MAHKHEPQLTAGVRVYHKGNGAQGIIVSRKVRLGTVRWDDGRTEGDFYLTCLGVVGDAMHANYAPRSATV